MRLRRLRASLASALIAFVCLVAQAGDDPAQWRALAIERVLETAAKIPDAYRRAEALASIARVQADIAEERATDRTIQQALSAATGVIEPEFRGWALHDAALAQIARADLIGARETARSIEAARPHGALWAALAEIAVRGGDLVGAQQIAASIRDPEARSLVLRQVLAVMASRGDVESARPLLRRIDDEFYAAMARGDLAAADVRAGRIEQAHALAGRTPRKYRAEVYGRIALARLAANDLRGALESAGKITDVRERALVYGRIAAAQAEQGDLEAAGQLARNAVDSLDDDEAADAALTLARLGQVQIAAGDFVGARDTLQRALGKANHLPMGEARDAALDYVAREQARLGDSAAALESALRVSDRFMRAATVRDVIALQPDGASASRIAEQKFEDPLIEAAALFGALGAQLSAPNQTSPEATLAAAHAAVVQLNASLKPAALAALAAARTRSGAAGGEALFIEAMNAAAAFEGPDKRSSAYLSIATAINDRLMFLGRPEAQARP